MEIGEVQLAKYICLFVWIYANDACVHMSAWRYMCLIVDGVLYHKSKKQFISLFQNLHWRSGWHQVGACLNYFSDAVP